MYVLTHWTEESCKLVNILASKKKSTIIKYLKRYHNIDNSNLVGDEYIIVEDDREVEVFQITEVLIV